MGGWLAVDVASCFPANYIEYIFDSDSNVKGIRSIKILRILRLTKMLRVFRLAQIVERHVTVIFSLSIPVARTH